MKEEINMHSISEVVHAQLVSRKSGEVYSQSAVLTDLLSFQDIFVHHEILAPGNKASAPHIHTHTDEMVFVLKGFPTACMGSTLLQMKPVDFVGFLPGSQERHYIENKTDDEVRFLVICSNPKEDKVL